MTLSGLCATDNTFSSSATVPRMYVYNRDDCFILLVILLTQNALLLNITNHLNYHQDSNKNNCYCYCIHIWYRVSKFNFPINNISRNIICYYVVYYKRPDCKVSEMYVDAISVCYSVPQGQGDSIRLPAVRRSKTQSLCRTVLVTSQPHACQRSRDKCVTLAVVSRPLGVKSLHTTLRPPESRDKNFD